MDKILAVEGKCGSPLRRFHVSWQGSDVTTWEPYNNLPPSEIKDFLLANGQYEYNWSGLRCEDCDKPCKNERGLKIHKRRFCYCSKFSQQKYFNRGDQEQKFVGTKAEEAAKITKLKEAQALRPAVNCEGSQLENVFRFKYLGSIFVTDGEQNHDIQ